VEFELLNDPKVMASSMDWTTQQQFMQKTEDLIRETHGSVNSLRKVKKQVETLNDVLKSNENLKDVLKLGQDLVKKIDSWESTITETRAKGFQDALNWPGKFNSQLFRIRSGVDTHDPRVPAGYTDRLGDLQIEWSKHKGELNELINKDISQFNRTIKEKNVPALIIESKDLILNN
jgi:hypothetical protein